MINSPFLLLPEGEIHCYPPTPKTKKKNPRRATFSSSGLRPLARLHVPPRSSQTVIQSCWCLLDSSGLNGRNHNLCAAAQQRAGGRREALKALIQLLTPPSITVKHHAGEEAPRISIMQHLHYANAPSMDRGGLFTWGRGGGVFSLC